MFASARGIVGTIKQGVEDGAVILGGEIAQNKIVALGDKFVPHFGTSTTMAIARVGVLNIAVASGISLGTRKLLPKYSRMAAGGAWARAIANVLAQTPAAALLGDGVVYDDYRQLSGYVQMPSGMAAYPSPATADLPHGEH